MLKGKYYFEDYGLLFSFITFNYLLHSNFDEYLLINAFKMYKVTFPKEM